MTTMKVTLPKESLPIGAPSSPETAPTSNVFFGEFSAAKPMPLPNTVPLETLINEFEANPAMAQRLVQARRNLVGQMYADEPDTLSALRLAAGLSQAQLADRADTTQSHVARIESGKVDPGTEMVARIAAALGIDEVRAFNAIRKQITTRGQNNA